MHRARSSVIFLLSGLLGVSISIAQVRTYCSNIAGNIACQSYGDDSSSQSFCTSIGGNLSCTTYNSTNYDRAEIEKNYEAGQVIGTALGNAVLAAIDEYRANRRTRLAKEDEWNQFVQDTLASEELSCEADPAKSGTTLLGCRAMTFTFNQFLRKHQKDFVVDANNVRLLANALDKSAPEDQSTWSEQTYELAFQRVDKKNLDKKIYVERNQARVAWEESPQRKRRRRDHITAWAIPSEGRPRSASPQTPEG